MHRSFLNFDVIKYIYFFLLLPVLLMSYQKIIAKHNFMKIPPIFSYKCFMDLASIFMSLIHFWANFCIWCKVRVQLLFFPRTIFITNLAAKPDLNLYEAVFWSLYVWIFTQFTVEIFDFKVLLPDSIGSITWVQDPKVSQFQSAPSPKSFRHVGWWVSNTFFSEYQILEFSKWERHRCQCVELSPLMDESNKGQGH